MTEITVSVQAEPRDIDSWVALARRIESSGFDALLMGDHPGSGASPWPALGAAAAVTSTLRLGTYVLQAGVRDPVHAAADAATLDLLAPGRVLFGLGAGHTFAEWEVTGRMRPSASERTGRLVEFVDVVARLLQGGTVTAAGDFISVVNARLDDLPANGRVRLVIGGGNPEVLRLATAHADVVGLSGLGRTLPDGHRHTVRWSRADLDAQLHLIARERERCGTIPEIEALVQVVTVTEDRSAALAELSEGLSGATREDLDTTPFVLVGSVEEIVAQLTRHAEELGITRYVVREPSLAAMERVLGLMKQTLTPARLSR